MIEALRQGAILIVGIATMGSLMGVLTSIVTATGPGENTVAWGTVAVLSLLAFIGCMMLLGALSP